MFNDLPARGSLRLRSLLRPARGGLRAADVERRRAQAPHPGGAAHALALRGLPPAGGSSALGAAHRLDAAGEGRPARRAPRPRRGVGQERDGQPDPLVQGPRGLRRARPRAGARLPDHRLRLDRQPRQRRRRALRRRRPARLRADPGRPRGAEDPRHRRLRGQRGRDQGQLRRRQPPLHRDRRRARRLGVRQRQRAPLLRRGLQDAGLRGRRAARLGAPGPRGRADRLRLAVHEARARVPGVDRLRAARGRAAAHERRPGARAAPRSPRRSRPARRSAARSSPTRSPSRWPSATPPTARTRSSWRRRPAAASTR